MKTRAELQADERNSAIERLRSAVFTARGVTPALTVDDIQDIVDAGNVEYDGYAARRRALDEAAGLGRLTQYAA
jgi:hypothetical protein